jgi:hypothetical protein
MFADVLQMLAKFIHDIFAEVVQFDASRGGRLLLTLG